MAAANTAEDEQSGGERPGAPGNSHQRYREAERNRGQRSYALASETADQRSCYGDGTQRAECGAEKRDPEYTVTEMELRFDCRYAGHPGADDQSVYEEENHCPPPRRPGARCHGEASRVDGYLLAA